MRRLGLLVVLALAACAPANGPRGGEGPPLRPAANPSAVIAAEIAFARLAQDKGQWTAFRETAAKGAEMFVPERVLAAQWLRGRADPPVSVRWQPAEVWSSCDGSFAVTRGSWLRPGSAGSFVTVWQRQKDGGHKWLLDMSLAEENAAAAPDTVAAQVADCPRRPREGAALSVAIPASTTAARSGRSDDGTLGWAAHSSPEKRDFTLWIIKDGAVREVLSPRIDARRGN